MYEVILTRFTPAPPEAVDTLIFWRVRILLTIILSAMALGTPALVISFFIALEKGTWGLAVSNVAFFFFGWIVLLSKRMGYRFRAMITLTAFYCIGLYVILFVGFLSGGPAWLFGFSVLVGVLLGAKAAICAVILNTVTITIVGWLMYTGLYGQDLPFFQSTETMIAGGANFILLNAISALSVAVLVKGLVVSNVKEKALIHKLKKEHSHLIDAKEILKSEIEERRQAVETANQLSQQLQRAQKMEALGTLAGGVAHDLNNILSGIVSYPDLILNGLPEDHKLRPAIKVIQQSGEKAAAIVQDLLTLARRGVSTNEIIDIGKILDGILHGPELKALQDQNPRIRMAVNISEETVTINGSMVYLEKTILNLVVNAFEAMPGDGVLSISLDTAAIDANVSGYDPVREDIYARLTVTDNGVGISNSDLERIFEPFFTKKTMGRSGTGLGMAVVWGTVKDHGGYIDVKSEPDRGTRFCLYFPLAQNSQSQPKPESPPMPVLKGKGQRILLVDDMSEQLVIGNKMLSHLGYRAATAGSGESAVRYIREHPVDLVILDMIMPAGMDGLETYRQILEIRSGMPAIIASGYAETDRVQQALKLGASAYVRKPYTLEVLGAAVKKALTKKSDSTDPA